MNRSARNTLGDRFAGAALLLAAIAAGAGLLLSDLYRDNEAWIRQARATDLVTLLVAVPLLALSLRRAGAGSPAARLVAVGALGYLVYSYAIFAFSVAINAMTPLHIAILGLATWALILAVTGLDAAALDAAVGARLPRRTSATALILISVLFGSLWLGQIAGAITSGTPPAEVARLGLPTNPVYVLDLAFALPLLALAGIRLLRRGRAAGAAAVATLVWTAVMGLSILAIFAFDAAASQAVDPVVVAIIGSITAAAAALAVVGLLPPLSGPVLAAPERATSQSLGGQRP
jgi:hypothetical protein